MNRHPAPAIASSQAGVFSSTQARDSGLTARKVRYRIRSGAWHPVLGTGITALPPPHPRRMQVWAAVLTHPASAVSHVSAAREYGWPVPDDGLVHVSGPRRVRSRPGIVLHDQRIPPRDTHLDDGGLPMTAQRRTAIDTLMLLPWRDAERLWAWLATRDVLGRAELGHALHSHTGTRGVRNLLRLWTTSAGGAVNGGESRLHSLLGRAGITGWRANAPIESDGRVIAVADVLFARERLIIEFDGYAAHSTRDAFVRDRKRQNRLSAAGYRILRLTWDDVVNHPEETVRLVRSMLGR